MKFAHPIAIVGIGGVFPDAPNLEKFWSNLLNRINSSRRPPEGRWTLPPEEAYLPGGPAPDRVYSQKSCFIENFDIGEYFDPQKYNLAPSLVEKLDLLYQLTLAAGTEAFNDACTGNLDRERVGVILGNIALPTGKVSDISWEILGRTFQEKVLGKKGFSPEKINKLNRYVTGLPAGLLAKALKLGGGTYTLDAACASSLYAVKLAANELLAGRADAMLSGGLCRPDCLYTQMGFSQLRAVSPDGICAPFDESGKGLVTGEGAGIMVLKRLEDALKDGDHVYAVIRGIGLSNDRAGNLLAPDTNGQIRCMHAAYKEAGWSPHDVDMIECHATGTPVGDAVEFESIRKFWGDSGWKKGQCILGAVKSNIGHLLTGAGAAGLIKVLLALKHKTIPPTANFKKPHPKLEMEKSPFRVNMEPEPWKKRDEKTPRRAAVSAFGFGGINAHVLLEEWDPADKGESKNFAIPAIPRKESVPIAVIGMDARFGPWKTLGEFRKRIFGEKDEVKPAPGKHRWGAGDAEWFREETREDAPLDGFAVNELCVPLGRFKIPPKELEEMLPQQIVMLQAAAGALKDAGVEKIDHLTSGLNVGVNLDLNTTNFHIRWKMPQKAREWAEELGLDLTGEELDQWIESLRDSFGPPLTANRTMGALGSVAGSRIAREYKFGGPSFVVSGEETSAMKALSVSIRALQQGEINLALAGAVDLAGDIRALISEREAYNSPDEPGPFGEGAGAVVLKRLTDAERDGDRIYAVLKGSGSASGGNPGEVNPDMHAFKLSVQRAMKDAGISSEGISFIEINENSPEEIQAEIDALAEIFKPGKMDSPPALGRTPGEIGCSGAAGGIASLIKTILCLHDEILPPMKNPSGEAESDFKGFYAPHYRQYWAFNREKGPRRALVGSTGVDGNCSHIVLEEYSKKDESIEANPAIPAFPLGEALFVVEGDTPADLLQKLERLDKFIRENRETGIYISAQKWHEENPVDFKAKTAVAMVSKSGDKLLKQIDRALAHLNENPLKPLLGSEKSLFPKINPDCIFYRPDLETLRGRLAFVFPGSGNNYPGMGRQLGFLWPGILRRQNNEVSRLRDLISPEYFWNADTLKDPGLSHNLLMIGHSSFCCTVSDLLRALGLSPGASIGYSLGESSALFALRGWKDRDMMLKRMKDAPLFNVDLAPPFNAARKAWNLPENEPVNWFTALLNISPGKVEKAMKGRERVYMLMKNAPAECLVGGEKPHVEKLIEDLQCSHIPLPGVTVAHCDIVRQVEKDYYDFHLYPTEPLDGIDNYSAAWEKPYELTRERAADAILQQCLKCLDFPAVIWAAYDSGVRVFIETGPGSSCTRMIGEILKDKSHLAVSVSSPINGEVSALLQALAALAACRIPFDITSLYSWKDPHGETEIPGKKGRAMEIKIPVGGDPFRVSIPKKQVVKLAPVPAAIEPEIEPVRIPAMVSAPVGKTDYTAPCGMEPPLSDISLQFQRVQAANVEAHSSFLQLSRDLTDMMAQNIAFQTSLMERAGGAPAGLIEAVPPVTFTQPQKIEFQYAPSPDLSASCISPVSVQIPEMPVMCAEIPSNRLSPSGEAPFLDRDKCMEFAIGSISKVLGEKFAEIDKHPTRVRLPDEPLMLVDRIMKVEGEPCSMTCGRVITEHDIHPGAWYLDAGRIPTCIAVESGQADLFLSGFLGIDFETKGKAVYRLLDAVVNFHRALPGPGETLRYDIRIKEFFRQGNTYLFRFEFDGTVNGEPMMTMRDGCAGFFTNAELDAGRGIVIRPLDLRPIPGKIPPGWKYPVPMSIDSYADDQVDALRKGDLSGCFGPLFDNLPVKNPLTIPGGRMKLIDRVLNLDPKGGRYGLGLIRAEADIHPDDWFLTCHFCDDNVMPGTLMYECCMHTLRVFLLRMGWVAENDGNSVWEPIPGVASGLKCRGQVIESTKKAAYEISIKEMGYNPEPYVIADGLMYADGRPVVEVTDMSIRLSGSSCEVIEKMWAEKNRSQPAVDFSQPEPALYDQRSILEFAEGKPSLAFGKKYEIFDDGSRFIARLPRPPYSFMTRVTKLKGEPWKMVPGGIVESQYEIPADEWFFDSNRQDFMPFAVLLEIPLQVCGWMAAYMGSALHGGDTALQFRNLGGSAVMYKPVDRNSRLLTSRIKTTKISDSGGMIIQNYEFEVFQSKTCIYRGDTYFGFFSRQALANQVGIRDAHVYKPSPEEISSGKSCPFPVEPPYPDEMLGMIDRVELYVPDGGPNGLGFIRGSMDVDPDTWFFKAHFYQDPVIPGSLGLESMLQLLRFAAHDKWGINPGKVVLTVAPGVNHKWIYRGQVIPKNRRVIVDAWITSIDEKNQVLFADGYLTVDGLTIYGMKDFSLRMWNIEE